MRGFAFDLRLVWRRLRRSPGFAIIFVLMSAFGIGAMTAIFLVVDGEMLWPPPCPHADRLVTLVEQASGFNWVGAIPDG